MLFRSGSLTLETAEMAQMWHIRLSGLAVAARKEAAPEAHRLLGLSDAEVLASGATEDGVEAAIAGHLV